jgi:hypothetical protein
MAICLIVGVVIVGAPAFGRVDDPAKPVSFREQIAPILVRKCAGCHDDRKSENGLNLATFASLRRGGKGFGTDIVIPGDPDASGLVTVIGPDGPPRMPLKQPPLADDEFRDITRWIKEGAKFDGGSETETRLASLVDPLNGLPKVSLKAAVSDPITSLMFSPDGQRLASAVGGDVVIWDARTGRRVSSLPGAGGEITSVRFSPDGRTIVAAGGRPGMFGSVVIWNLEKPMREREWRGHNDCILDAAISPDGRLLATASYDRLVKLWDLRSGKEVQSLSEHTDAVNSVAFSPDGRMLASAAGDRTIKVWDVATGKKRVTLSESSAELQAVAFAPDNKTVLAGGVDRSIRAWEVMGETGSLVRSAFAHDGAIVRLVAAPDGKTLLSSGEDRAIKVWDLATLQARATLADQSDWPLGLAVSPDSRRIAVGRYDGSLTLFDATSFRDALALRDAPTGPLVDPGTGKRKLVNNASLDKPSPRGARRGATVKVVLTGTAVGQANAVAFLEPGIAAKILKLPKTNPNRLEVEFQVATDAIVGVHRFVVRTPLGTPSPQPFAVLADAEMPETEPNDDSEKAQVVDLPATLSGAIQRAGDLDVFRFSVDSAQTLIFRALAKPLGSDWDGEFTVVDASGKIVARSSDSEPNTDPYLVFKPPRCGQYELRVADRQFGGSPNHFYLIRAGVFELVERVQPLGVAIDATNNASDGSREHGSGSVTLAGPNLSSDARLDLTIPKEAKPGTALPILVKAADGARLSTGLRVTCTTGAQAVEGDGTAGGDTPAHAIALSVPGGASGAIAKPGDVDYFRFTAKKGHPLILETHGRRLGTAIDSAIEVLDLQGKSIPRAVLRPVEETAVAFRDHGSGGRNIRLTQWNDFAEGDFVLIGRELTRVFELPRNPDDDAVMWGMGTARNRPGERIAFLETTPEHHPLAQPIYKVELHPPGATFPPGGVPPVTLFYRNDDGGPGYGKDSKLTFDPPADGDYVVRVSDARSLGSSRSGYHLEVRPPRPDFELSVSPENPNVPRGGSTVVTVSAIRRDGFDGPIDVSVDGLPPGITATSTRIEAGVYAAELLISADATAPAFNPPSWKVTGVATLGSSANDVISHTIDPGGPNAGWITVTPEPNLKVRFEPEKVTIRPGQRIEMKLRVDRSPAFAGRVPFDVRNLPRGVRVLNIGLNGVLITEKQTERSIFIYAEPWAEPQERTFFAVGKCESANTEHASGPIPLVIEPPPPAVAAQRAAP